MIRHQNAHVNTFLYKFFIIFVEFSTVGNKGTKGLYVKNTTTLNNKITLKNGLVL